MWMCDWMIRLTPSASSRNRSLVPLSVSRRSSVPVASEPVGGTSWAPVSWALKWVAGALALTAPAPEMATRPVRPTASKARLIMCNPLHARTPGTPRRIGRPVGPRTLRTERDRPWWAATGSNRRPLACQASALPAELAALDQRGGYSSCVPPYLGRAMPRREDARLVSGRGRYAGDIKLEGLAHIAFVRSPHAHARVTSIDTAAAQSMPGVIRILTAKDLPANARAVKNWLPAEMEHLARPVLAQTEVNSPGDAAAAVT